MKTKAFLLTLAIVVAGCKSAQSWPEEPSFEDPASKEAVAEKRKQRERNWEIENYQPEGSGAAPAAIMSDGMAWSSMAYPTGNTATSGILIQKGMPTEVRVNEEFDYLIKVTNLTDLTLESVNVSDVLGPNFTLISSDPKATKGADGALMWDLGSLGPREVEMISVKAKATKEGTVSSCATVSYNSQLCAAIPVVQPKLSITKAGPAEVLKCEDIVYTFEVKNTGSGSVTGVKVTDNLPAGVKTKDGKSTVTFDVGTLGAGKTRAFKMTARADKKGKFTNKATVSGSGLSADSNSVSTTVKEPMLTITKTGPKKQFIGRTSEYTIVVKNTGDGEARSTVVEDRLPSGTTYVGSSTGGSRSGSSVKWSLGTLAPNASRTLTVSLRADKAGTYRNTATVTAFCADAKSATAETVYEGIPAILLEVVDVEDPVEVGDQTTYVITATNQGSAPGTNIKIVATLEPATMSLVSSSGATTGSASGSNVTFAPLASLAAGQKASWRVVVRAAKAGDVRFKVAMNSDQLGRPVEETEATNFYE